MSFPPRPPMGMAPMGYGYPMGMMPMQMNMGMMPQQMMNRSSSGSSSSVNSGPKQSKKLVPQEIPKDNKNDKPPVTTVFVGNISDRAPDAMIRQMLQRCGNVISWKRVQGASGKLQAFGFCEYEDPEATLRCMRLLNDWMITDRKLVVKVDAKTKVLLDEYKKKKAKEEQEKPPEKEPADKENGENGDTNEEEQNGEKEKKKDGLDEFTLREDRVAKAGLDAIMREYSEDLSKEPPAEPTAEEKKEKRKELRKEKIKEETKEQGLDDMEIEEETKNLITREIKSFRDAHKGEEEKEQERSRERERRRREEERERERRERERERERRERERERETRERDRERERRSHSHERSRSGSRERERERRDRDRDRDRELEDEEELYERRKLERKLREKEAAYQERLKMWEARERKKTREYEKELEKEDERKSEETREARRLREFLEDYDDERDDPKFYKGSALQRRMKEREKEMELDARDRQREKEEIEDIRRKFMESGNAELGDEVARLERERDEHLMPRLNTESTPEPEPVEQRRDSRQEREQQREMMHNERHREERHREERHREERHRDSSDERHRDIREAHEAPQPLPQEPWPPQQAELRSPVQAARGTVPVQYISEPEEVQTQPVLQPPPRSRSDSSSDLSDADDSMPPAAMMSDDSQSQPFIGPATRGNISRHAPTGPAFASIRNDSASNTPQGYADSPADTHKHKKKLTMAEVFNQDDDSDDTGKRRRLVPIDYDDNAPVPAPAPAPAPAPRPTTAEEKRKCIKNLIERIPTQKDELFAYPLDWNMVDTTLMDRRIKPWVNKKIVEYIGEEEPTLTDFICQKVMGHSPPNTILNDVTMVLDEEAEVFVVKMWRLLIYETEAKKEGLVK